MIARSIILVFLLTLTAASVDAKTPKLVGLWEAEALAAAPGDGYGPGTLTEYDVTIEFTAQQGTYVYGFLKAGFINDGDVTNFTGLIEASTFTLTFSVGTIRGRIIEPLRGRSRFTFSIFTTGPLPHAARGTAVRQYIR